MSRISIAAASGLAFVCLLTAGDSGCPTCIELACKIVNGDVHVSGPALDERPDAARFVIETATASCELTVDPDDLSVQPSNDWSIALAYDEACGEVIEHGALWGETQLGVCASATP